MSTSNKKGIVRGKRYSAEEKGKVVSYVTDHNAENGRGGQSSAAAKFGISQLTIATWLKSAGVSSKGTKGGGGGKGNMQDKLNSMLSLGQEIEKLEQELGSKRSKFKSLKASL